MQASCSTGAGGLRRSPLFDVPPSTGAAGCAPSLEDSPVRYRSQIPPLLVAAVALAAAGPSDARAQVTPPPKERAPVLPRAALQPPQVTYQTTSQDTLICRGGGGESGLYFRVSTEFVGLQMLRRGTAPATTGLAAGECSFRNRGFAAGDPDYVRFFQLDGRGYPTSVGVDVVYGAWPDCGANPFQVKCTWTRVEFPSEGRELVRWLNDLLDPAKQWVLAVSKHQGAICPAPCWRLTAAWANTSPVPLKP